MNLMVLAIVVMGYLVAMTLLAYKGYRETRSRDDYMVAGRNVQPWIMALSYGSTFISTSAIVGFGGAAGNFGFSLLWLAVLNILLGIWVAFALFGTRIRDMSARLGARTFASFLGKRYDSRFITVFSGLMIFLFMPAYTSIIMVGCARFLEEAMKINFNLALFLTAIIVGMYVITGGLKAVMYTDAFCAGLMLVGMAILLVASYSAVGGIVAGHRGLTAIAHLVPEALAKGGHRGWTAMPALGSPIWWTVVSTIVMGVGIGVLAQPQLLLRFLTVKDNRAIYRGISVGGVFLFLMTGTAFMVGPLSNLYFYNTQGQISIDVAKGNIDLIMPTFVKSLMPEWFLYLFMLTLLSAAISTLVSLIHVQGAALGEDILGTLGVGAGDRAAAAPGKKKGGAAAEAGSGLYLARIGVGVGTLTAIALAYVLPGSIIARATAFWFGICAAGFLPAFIGGLFWPRVSRCAAAASIVCGYAVSMFGFAFLHASEAKPLGLAKALFGRDTLFGYPWTHVDPLFYALPISALVLVAITLARPAACCEAKPAAGPAGMPGGRSAAAKAPARAKAKATKSARG